jgi:hypothetical protein
MNIGQNTSVGDGHLPQQPAQLFIIPHGQLNVARNNPRLLVVTRRVSSQLENLRPTSETMSDILRPHKSRPTLSEAPTTYSRVAFCPSELENKNPFLIAQAQKKFIIQ